MKRVALLLVSIIIYAGITAQSVQTGPYTVFTIGEGVYHIEDANDSNPAGAVIGDDGQATSMNNCSDMYLIVGAQKALLIDLSNAIKWDSTAKESLRSLVYERVGERQFLITITHKHGDHLGMLPAFADDVKAEFWIPEDEFNSMDIFPKERTSYFKANASLDLGGGVVVNTMEVPGHTDHSTLFFLRGKNMVFTGDAIGSGSGVWLFSYDNFISYIKGINSLIAYIENPANGIDTKKLIVYGGHFWQKGKVDQLTAQYIYDMRTLIGKIGEGTAEVSDMSSFISFLNANFRYGTATITWNKDAAAEYAESLK